MINYDEYMHAPTSEAPVKPADNSSNDKNSPRGVLKKIFGKGNPPAENSKPVKSLDITHFQRKVESGVNINTKTGKVEGTKELSFKITPEMDKEFQTYLHTFLGNIDSLRYRDYPGRTDKRMLDFVLENKNHRNISLLWEKLVVGGKDAGGEIDWEKTDANIQNFLSTDSGYIQTHLLISDYTQMMERAVGLVANELPQDQRERMLKDFSIVFEPEEGRFKWLNKFTRIPQEKTQFIQSAASLSSLDRNERNFVLALAGIDADALTPEMRTRMWGGIAPTGRVAPVVGQEITPASSLKSIKDQIRIGHHAQHEFAKALGKKSGDKTDLPWTAEIQDAYNRRAYEHIEAGHELTEAAHIKFTAEARRDVMVRRLQDEATRRLNEKKAGGRIERLNAERGTRETGGEANKKRVEKITKEKDALSKDRDALDGELGKIEDYKNQIDAYRDKKRNRETQGRGSLNKVLSSIRSSAGGFTDPQEAIAALYKVQEDVDGAIIINGKPIKSTLKRTQDANAALDEPFRARGEHESEKEYNLQLANFNKTKNDSYVRMIKARNDDLEILENAMGDIQKAIRPKEEGMEPPLDTNSQVAGAEKILSRMEREFMDITGMDGVGGVFLRETDLPNLSVEQILQRVNTAHAEDPSRGWPESQNGREDIRLRVLHAQVEAKARTLSLELDVAETDPLAELLRVGISENRVRTLSPEELLLELNEQLKRRGEEEYVSSPEALQGMVAASEHAMRRLDVRATAYEEYIEGLDSQIQEKEHEIGGVGKEFAPVLLKIEAVEHLVTRQDELLSNGKLEEIMLEPARFTSEETGYEDMLDFFFSYKTRNDKEKYLEAIKEVLPSNELAKILRDTLNLREDIEGEVNLGEAFFDLRRKIEGGDIYERNLRSVVKRITDETYEKTIGREL